jgi:enediyne biosynthesis protein E4
MVLGKFMISAFAAVVFGLLYLLAQEPSLSSQALQRLADGFQFSEVSLVKSGSFFQEVRAVNQGLLKVNAWVSSVGSSIAVGDLDGDGYPNDLCLVDPRLDLVFVLPVPPSAGEPLRFTQKILPSPPVFFPEVMAPFGCRMGDLNEDGRMDLLVSFGGRPPAAYLQVGFLDFQPQEILPTEKRQSWITTNITLADLNGDSHLDIILGHYFQDDFSILDAEDGETQTVMPESMSRALNGGSNRFLLWRGATREPPSVVYEEVSASVPEEVLTGWTLGLGVADLNDDLLPEIYFANDFGKDRLLVNHSTRDRLQFELAEGKHSPLRPPSYELGRDSFKGMGVEFADLNRDGQLDIYVSNVGEYEFMEGHYLYMSNGNSSLLNQGVAPYENLGMRMGLHKSGWGWGVRLADFNNDGELEALQATGFIQGEVDQWPEFQELSFCSNAFMDQIAFWPRFAVGDDVAGYQKNPFHVLHEDYYYDISTPLKMDQPTLARGIATSDIDGDGDLDLLFSNQWSPSLYYRNDCKNCGTYLGLNLVLPLDPVSYETQIETGLGAKLALSRPAFGATARLKTGKFSGRLSYVDGGSGHSGQRSPQIHFGLGQQHQNEPVVVELRWRDIRGQVHQKDLKLRPGWYTIYLGDQRSNS